MEGKDGERDLMGNEMPNVPAAVPDLYKKFHVILPIRKKVGHWNLPVV